MNNFASNGNHAYQKFYCEAIRGYIYVENWTIFAQCLKCYHKFIIDIIGLQQILFRRILLERFLSDNVSLSAPLKKYQMALLIRLYI